MRKGINRLLLLLLLLCQTRKERLHLSVFPFSIGSFHSRFSSLVTLSLLLISNPSYPLRFARTDISTFSSALSHPHPHTKPTLTPPLTSDLARPNNDDISVLACIRLLHAVLVLHLE